MHRWWMLVVGWWLVAARSLATLCLQALGIAWKWHISPHSSSANPNQPTLWQASGCAVSLRLQRQKLSHVLPATTNNIHKLLTRKCCWCLRAVIETTITQQCLARWSWLIISVRVVSGRLLPHGGLNFSCNSFWALPRLLIAVRGKRGCDLCVWAVCVSLDLYSFIYCFFFFLCSLHCFLFAISVKDHPLLASFVQQTFYYIYLYVFVCLLASNVTFAIIICCFSYLPTAPLTHKHTHPCWKLLGPYRAAL